MYKKELNVYNVSRQWKGERILMLGFISINSVSCETESKRY